jgi:hypothetical protein
MHFFLKQGQKICPNLLLDKKRIAQLINGKPGENRYNKIMRETKPDAMHFDMVHVRATLGNPAYPPKPQLCCFGRKEGPDQILHIRATCKKL